MIWMMNDGQWWGGRCDHTVTYKSIAIVQYRGRRSYRLPERRFRVTQSVYLQSSMSSTSSCSCCRTSWTALATRWAGTWCGLHSVISYSELTSESKYKPGGRFYRASFKGENEGISHWVSGKAGWDVMRWDGVRWVLARNRKRKWKWMQMCKVTKGQFSKYPMHTTISKSEKLRWSTV